jgi:hypothetical protein
LSTDVFVLLIVCAITIALALAMIRMVKGITFFSTNTDNANQVRAAAQIGKWRWPSGMHKYGNSKTRMKDGVVILLAGMQRLLRNRDGDYPLIVLCIVANSVSAVLVFLVASRYWNPEVGLLAYGLFVTCVWQYQIALFGGHICTAQMFFLIAVYLMPGAVSVVTFTMLARYFTAGMAVGLMMFSSASARKYLPLLVGAFLYSLRQVISIPGQEGYNEVFSLSGVEVAILCLVVVMLFVAVAICLFYKSVVKAMYYERAPRVLNRVIKDRTKANLEESINEANGFTRFLSNLCLLIAFCLAISVALAHFSSFYWAELLTLLGVAAVILLLTIPDIINNLLEYYRYWRAGNVIGHFRLYLQYFNNIGKPISDDMRGDGWTWVFRYFSLMVPVHFAIYIINLIIFIWLLVQNGGGLNALWGSLAVFILSIAPILIGEITHGIQLGRSYYPALLGMLLLIGYTAFRVEQMLSLQARTVLWGISIAAVLASAGWSSWLLLDDIWPARMAPAWLGRTLKSLGIKEFYTYDTPYNDAFVNTLPPAVLGQYKIHYIKSLSEVKEGYVVVPGTSSKALNMESSQWAIEHGDFNLDKDLNRILESKAIAGSVVASFKTFGTSRIWVHESEVSSYRAIILKEVKNVDLWRGRAWVLDAAKLRAERQSQ